MRYTRHIKARKTSLGLLETGICEQGSVITEAVQAILKQDGDEVNLVTVDEDTQLFALEVLREGSYALHVMRTERELKSLLEKYAITEELVPTPNETQLPTSCVTPDFRCAVHYQGTASFAGRLHFKPEEATP